MTLPMQTAMYQALSQPAGSLPTGSIGGSLVRQPSEGTTPPSDGTADAIRELCRVYFPELGKSGEAPGADAKVHQKNIAVLIFKSSLKSI